MPTAVQNRIAKLRFREPIRNLPSYKSNGGVESKFAYRFAQAYVDQFRKLHRNTGKNRIAVAREIPANGYGIADLVAVKWKSRNMAKPMSAESFIIKYQPTVRAFEIKMSDWRKALMQANRYRFFAHAPIVVLPSAKVGPALKYLETFRGLGVGLWSFDIETNRITKHFTPRPHRPVDLDRHAKVLSSVAMANKTTKALQVF
jgi:hypothetical protein